MIYFSSLLIEEQIQFITECNSIFSFSYVGRKYLFYLRIGATVIQALFFLLNNWNKLKEPDIIMPSFLEFMNFTEQLLFEWFSVLLSSVIIPRLDMWHIHSDIQYSTLVTDGFCYNLLGKITSWQNPPQNNRFSSRFPNCLEVDSEELAHRTIPIW